MVHDVINNHGVFHHHGDINHHGDVEQHGNIVHIEDINTMLTSTTFVLITNSILLTTLVLPNTDYPSGLRAESARAVTGRRNSHRWEGGRLFELSAGFFYGNSCNFGTKSRKIVSKVGN